MTAGTKSIRSRITTPADELPELDETPPENKPDDRRRDPAETPDAIASMNQPKPLKDDSARSPFAGCAILIAALVVMVFLIGFSVLTLFRQFNEIAKFTGDKPVPIEVSSHRKPGTRAQQTRRAHRSLPPATRRRRRSLARPIRRRPESRHRRLRRLQGTSRHLPRHQPSRVKPCASRFHFRSTANRASPAKARPAGSPRTRAISTAPWSPARIC